MKRRSRGSGDGHYIRTGVGMCKHKTNSAISNYFNDRELVDVYRNGVNSDWIMFNSCKVSMTAGLTWWDRNKDEDSSDI